MHFSTAVVAAFAATYVSASPLMARGNTCGTTPAGSNTNNQPISQPSGIQTSSACQSACAADSSCQSFCFGLVDNTIECKLYSCAASAVPTQSSANLVVYDKACTAVPSVVPTTSNPTGKKVDNSQEQSSSNSGTKTSEQKAQESQKVEAQKATESKQAQASTGNTYVAQKQTEKESSKKESSKKESSKSSSASTCGTKPSASTNNQPISTPSVTSETACKAKCQADSTCMSFACGEVNNAFVCKLYSVAAAQVPAPSTTAQKNVLKAYDVSCSI